MKSNCIFVFLFLKQFLTDSVEQEDYLSQMEMRNGNITDIYQANVYQNIDGIQDKKSDDYYKQIANVETYLQIDVKDKEKKKNRKLLDEPVYLYKQLHIKSDDEIQQFRNNLRQVRQRYQQQQNNQDDISYQSNSDRNLNLFKKDLPLENNNIQKFKPQERNLRQKKRKLFMPPMVIMFGPHMYTPEVQSPQMRINLGENKILYDKNKKEEKEQKADKISNIFSVNAPDYMPSGRGLSTIDVRKQWKLFQKKFLIQII